MPGAVPQTSSQAICAAILPYVQRLAGDKKWRHYTPLAKGVNIENGKIVHPALKGMKL
jgi:alanine dehydrogenase